MKGGTLPYIIMLCEYTCRLLIHQVNGLVKGPYGHNVDWSIQNSKVLQIVATCTSVYVGHHLLANHN